MDTTGRGWISAHNSRYHRRIPAGIHTMIPEALLQEIRAFEAMKGELEKAYWGKFVIIKGGHLEGFFDTFDAAARDAVAKFGAGPYLIRQVGMPATMPMPASVAYRPIHAAN